MLDWLWFTAKGRLRWIDPVKWLTFPLVYGGWTLVHGLTTHWWPYGFVYVDALGLGRVIAIFGGLLTFFPGGRSGAGRAGSSVWPHGA